VPAKGKRQEAKGKNDLPCHDANELSSAATYPSLLPFGFCLLPFAFSSQPGTRLKVSIKTIAGRRWLNYKT